MGPSLSLVFPCVTAMLHHTHPHWCVPLYMCTIKTSDANITNMSFVASLQGVGPKAQGKWMTGAESQPQDS